MPPRQVVIFLTKQGIMATEHCRELETPNFRVVVTITGILRAWRLNKDGWLLLLKPEKE